MGLSKYFGGGNKSSSSHRTVCISRSTQNPALMVAQWEDALDGKPPLYSILPHGLTQNMFVVWEGQPDPNHQTAPIGSLVCASTMSANDINLRGHQMNIKMHKLTGNFEVNNTPMGQLSWKLNQMSGGISIRLQDSSGNKLAKTKGKAAGTGDQIIEFEVNPDQALLEIAIISGYMARALQARSIGHMVEAVGASAGISAIATTA